MKKTVLMFDVDIQAQRKALYLACRRLVTLPQACLGCPVQRLQCSERVPTVRACAERLTRYFMGRAR